jgi:hypothetical protein
MGDKTVHHLIALPLDVGNAPLRPKRSRQRRLSLAAMLRQVSNAGAKAGVNVSSVTVGPDGTVSSLMFGEPLPSNGNGKNPWDEVLIHASHEKRSS